MVVLLSRSIFLVLKVSVTFASWSHMKMPHTLVCRCVCVSSPSQFQQNLRGNENLVCVFCMWAWKRHHFLCQACFGFYFFFFSLSCCMTSGSPVRKEACVRSGRNRSRGNWLRTICKLGCGSSVFPALVRRKCLVNKQRQVECDKKLK